MNVILADLPEHIKGMTVRTFDEEECYTIVLNSRLSWEQQLETYRHELNHIADADFNLDCSPDTIEWLKHVG